MELTVETLTTWMNTFEAKINAKKAYLSELDTPIGDGDHGNNMARGMRAVTEALATKKPADLTTGLKLVAMSLISKVRRCWAFVWDCLFRNGQKEQYDC